MFYFVYFDPKEGITRDSIMKAYSKYAEYFKNKVPRFNYIGLYGRSSLLGSRPHYVAIWEFSNYSDLDEWNKVFGSDKKGQRLAKELRNLTSNWEAKIMSKLA